METKPLLYGLIGFFIGGLVVSVAATTFEKPEQSTADLSMTHMVESLRNKQGDDFDKEFISSMIAHHVGAVEMAEIAAKQAKHTEIKQLSSEIITAQNSEIETMKRWQSEWGYRSDMTNDHMSHQ